MTASRAIPPRFVLPLVLLVPLILVFLPAPNASPVSFPEVVSPFDETDPPAVHNTAVPIPWQDDVFTGWIPSLPWSHDDTYRKARVSRTEILKHRPATSSFFSWGTEWFPSVALAMMTGSLLIGRPPPQGVPSTG
ncbi:MAG: hypothetical protein HZB86_00300 [Deltaproteobacteria bacterium]|nr:hypothetical protein [Deltaproteobacteria bacterium]